MGQTADFRLDPEYLEWISNLAFNGKTYRLIVIPNSAAITPSTTASNKSAILAAEFNGSGWSRPALTIPTSGAFDGANSEWDISTVLEWIVTGPSGGIDIKQISAIVDGVATPRDSTGKLMGIITYATPITVSAGQQLPIRIPWSILAT
jgi:hypothetical protein